MTDTYDSQLRDFWYKQKADVTQFLALVLYHSAFGYIRLVQNQFEPITFQLDGVPTEFTPAPMALPQDVLIDSDDSQKGAITFNYISVQIREKLRAVQTAVSFEPITARLLMYLEGVTNPVRDLTLYAGDISLTSMQCSIELTLGNPAKQAKASRVYTSAAYPALRYV